MTRAESDSPTEGKGGAGGWPHPWASARWWRRLAGSNGHAGPRATGEQLGLGAVGVRLWIDAEAEEVERSTGTARPSSPRSMPGEAEGGTASCLFVRGVALAGKKQDGGDPRWSSRRDADPCAEEGTRRSTAAAACDTASTAAPDSVLRRERGSPRRLFLRGSEGWR